VYGYCFQRVNKFILQRGKVSVVGRLSKKMNLLGVVLVLSLLYITTVQSKFLLLIYLIHMITFKC